MPVCRLCRASYHEGESHECEVRTNDVLRALVGAGIGAFIGLVGLTVYYGVTTGSAQAGLVGVFLGGPMGAITGAIIGVSARHR